MKPILHLILFGLLSYGTLQGNEFDNWYFKFLSKPCVYECKSYLVKESGRELVSSRTSSSSCKLSADGKIFTELWETVRPPGNKKSVSKMEWTKRKDGSFHCSETSPKGVDYQCKLTLNPDKTGSQNGTYGDRLIITDAFSYTEGKGIQGTSEVRTMDGDLYMIEEYTIQPQQEAATQKIETKAKH